MRRFTLPSPTETHDASQRNVQILLVEDNPADALLVREALQEHDVQGELIVITNGQAAMEFVQAINDIVTCPDLLILDLNLPRRSGKEVLKEVRGNTSCAGIPIAVLSSSDVQQDRDEAAQLGASQYISKPARLEAFMALGSIFKAMATAHKRGTEARQ